MQTSVLIQNLTSEQYSENFEVLKNQIQELRKDLLNQKAQDELLTRDETCNLLKINSSTLWAWTNKGKVKAYGIANRRYYKRSELNEALIELKK
jgi:DNA invertase Pin-like site-specific DNA recombinase